MRVVIIGVDDWQCLYINGNKIEENHSLHVNFVLEKVADKFNEYFAETGDPILRFEDAYFEPKTREDEEWCEYGIDFPQTLNEADPRLLGDIAL